MVALQPGESLLHYRLTEKLGEGGMGVVWRALDTTLDREVAIKILPEAYAQDAERLVRFEREAKLLASLNHPNIAAVHSVHHAEGEQAGGESSLHFLAMELVPGEDLAARIARGPMPCEGALRIARQVATGLEAAHETGVIHRDLKPANVKLTPDGTAKILDFGVAKAIGPEPAGARAGGATDPATSPTLTSAGTRAGVILGTATYMSPEQAAGLAVDRRSDIWAFGMLLFEMLTGSAAFGGATVTHVLASVIKDEVDLDTLSPETPPAIRRLLARCFRKEPRDRLQSIGDARVVIEDVLDGRLAGEGAAPATERAGARIHSPKRTALLALAAVAVVALAAFAGWFGRGRSGGESGALPPSIHLSLTVPNEMILKAAVLGEPVLAFSPDGRRIAFVAREEDDFRLYLRAIDEPEPRALAGTEEASGPFFSPDGEWLGFFARGKLYKVSIRGGTPFELAEAPSRRGGAWSADDTLVYSPVFNAGLYRVHAEGGEPEVLTRVDTEGGERTHRWPEVLPNGRGILFTIGARENPGYYEDATIAVLDLESKRIKKLIEGGSIARYSTSGHLVYSRDGELLTVPFDVNSLTLTGPPKTVLGEVARDTSSGVVYFSLSRDGSLIYMPAGAESPEGNLVWVDRNGLAETIRTIPRPFISPRLSPDGRRAAIGIGRGPGDGDVWVFDLQSDRSTRLTFHNGALGAIWSPDGKRVAYGVTLGGQEGVVWKPADGSEVEQRIGRDSGQYAAVPEAWVPGTGTIIYSRTGGKGSYDLMSVALDRPEPEPLLETEAAEGGVTFSPDGRFMAYASNESGRYEVYVTPYPGPGGKWQLSTEGGKGPIWSADGREIFYTDGEAMMVVPVDTSAGFSSGAPVRLFRFSFERGSGPWPAFDVTRDGRRFLMVQRPADDPPPRTIHLVTRFADRF